MDKCTSATTLTAGLTYQFGKPYVLGYDSVRTAKGHCCNTSVIVRQVFQLIRGAALKHETLTIPSRMTFERQMCTCFESRLLGKEICPPSFDWHWTVHKKSICQLLFRHHRGPLGKRYPGSRYNGHTDTFSKHCNSKQWSEAML
jgi:hypothetical protein